MAQEKRQSFMKGAAILTASTLIVKILGLFFSIPLSNFIGDDGMSYFFTAYQIFAVFLTLSTAGLPVAVSRMVSTAYSQGRKKEADRVFFVAFWLFFAVGILGCAAMFFGAGWIADRLMANPGADKAIMALAPTMFFVSLMSALRGYFQGRSNMTPTAVSQTIEAVTKVVIGVGLAVYILNQFGSDAWAAVGAIIGVSISAFLGLGYLAAYKLRQSRRDRANRTDDPDELLSAPSGELLKSLLKFAVPITLGACFLNVLDLIGDSVLMNRLQFTAGFSEAQAQTMYTALCNARKYFDLPGAFVIPISTSLLPMLSGAVASHDQDSIDNITTLSLRVTLLISIPASVGMCLFSEPICGVLLAGRLEMAEAAAPLLAMLSIAIAFNSTLYTTNAILQSFGHPVIPVRNMAIGGVVKVVVSYVLNGMPAVNVMGSAISTVVSYLLIMILNFLSIRKILPGLPSMIKTALPMVFSALVMGAGSYGAYRALCLALPYRAAFLPAVVLAVALYAAAVLLTGCVTYEDVCVLPKGEVIARLLHMKKKSKPRHMR